MRIGGGEKGEHQTKRQRDNVTYDVTYRNSVSCTKIRYAICNEQISFACAIRIRRGEKGKSEKRSVRRYNDVDSRLKVNRYRRLVETANRKPSGTATFTT